MPVLTSVHPYKCTTHGMNKSSKEFIAKEIKRAWNYICMIKAREKIIEQILNEENIKTT